MGARNKVKLRIMTYHKTVSLAMYIYYHTLFESNSDAFRQHVTVGDEVVA